MAVGDVWKISIWCTLGNQAAVNVRYYRVRLQPGGDMTAISVAGFFNTTFSTPYRAVMSVNAFFYGVHAMKWRPAPPQVGAVSATAGQGGTVAGDVLPGQVSGLISLRTTNATRRGRGRVYIPFPSEADTGAQGNPTAAYLTNLGNLAGVFDNEVAAIGGGTDTTFTPVIFGRARPATPVLPALPEIITDVTVATAANRFATQRRRGGFGRPNTPPV